MNFEEFGVHRNRAVPSAHAIKTWVRNLEPTGSTLKKKGGSVKTVRTPENIAVVREAIERRPHRLRVATLCHSGCLKPAFDGFYTKITVQELEYRIQQEATGIPVEMLQRVIGDGRKGLTDCLERNVGQLSDVIFGE